jgi:multidrug resistance efflux pump
VSGPDREVTGAVLEKLVDPGELVTPQTFGGTRGPSSSLVAVANLQDLQIEVDIDESKLARVALGQRCVISPVSYPDKRYQGQVAEIAPEANRAKGTVQKMAHLPANCTGSTDCWKRQEMIPRHKR